MFKKQKEKNEFESLCNCIEDESIKQRILDAGNWYIEKAVTYKRIFYILSLFDIILPVTIPIINEMIEGDASKKIVTCISAVISIVSSLLTFTKCREKWTLYRNTVELIKMELSLYQAHKGGKKRLCKLVKRIEGIMQGEHSRWIGIIKKGSGKKKNP